MPKREKAGGETTFQNPLDGEDAATNFDDERDAPASGIDVQKATFDDDEAPSGAPQGDGMQSMSPRTQARVNAHYVQKFVGDNRKRQNAAHRYFRGTCCSRRTRAAVFGEATLDDLDDDPNLEQHKTKCEMPPPRAAWACSGADAVVRQPQVSGCCIRALRLRLYTTLCR